jgi:hypothetical protein
MTRPSRHPAAHHCYTGELDIRIHQQRDSNTIRIRLDPFPILPTVRQQPERSGLDHLSWRRPEQRLFKRPPRSTMVPPSPVRFTRPKPKKPCALLMLNFHHMLICLLMPRHSTSSLVYSASSNLRPPCKWRVTAPMWPWIADATRAPYPMWTAVPRPPATNHTACRHC